MTERRVRVSRRIAATPDEIFDVWADPVLLGEWITTGGRCTADIRPGGIFFIEMLHQGRLWPHFGEFLRVERPSLIEFTWHSESTGGTRSVVTVKIDEVTPGESELTLEHRELPDDRQVENHTQGWAEFMDVIHDFVRKLCGSGRSSPGE